MVFAQPDSYTMKARIYRPSKTAVSSGRRKTHQWIVETEPTSKKVADPLIGWIGSDDTDQQIRLHFPTREAAIAYCKRRGLDGIPDWEFYLAFSYFRFAAILQGVLRRALDGNASSDKAFAYGALAPLLARDAVALIDQASPPAA